MKNEEEEENVSARSRNIRKGVCENNKSKNFFDKMFYFVAVFSKKNKLDYAESYKVILEK